MKKILKLYRRWRYRRYYRNLWGRLLLKFIDKDRTLFDAENDAKTAFFLLTGYEYDYFNQDVSDQ